MSGLAAPIILRGSSAGIHPVIRPRAFALLFSVLAIVVMFALSATTLDAIGIPYTAATGGALFKIHPATYLAVIGLLFWILADGGPGPFIGRSWVESPGHLVFLMVIGLIIFQTVVQKSPISIVTDNFLLPFAIFAALMRLTRGELQGLATALQLFLLADSLLGYLEVVGHFHLVPLYVTGELVDYDWRARALLGHPLSNALITGVYIVTLALGQGPAGPYRRLLLIGFHMGAMVCFGGRTGMVLTLVALALIGCYRFAAILLGQRFRLEHAALGIVAVTGIALFLPIAADLGLFDQFLGRFVDDSGSANTRLAMLSIFRDMSVSEMLIAPDPTTIHATQLKLDLAIAIESAIFGSLARFGGIVASLLFIGVAFYFSEFVRRFGPKVLLPLGVYAVIATSNTSFSTKTTEIAMLSVVLFVQFSTAWGRDRATRSAAQ